jgi:hypothetical protein
MKLRLGLIFFSVVCIITLSCLFFHSSDKALLSSDAPAYLIKSHQHAINTGYWNLWSPESWLGQPYAPIAPDHNAAIFSQVPFPFTLTILYVSNLFLEGLGMFLLLRSLKLETFAAIFGAMALVLSNGIITLIFPGHAHKIYSFAWFPFSIALFLKGLESRSLKCFIGSGCFLGLAVLGGEMQMAYYLGLWFTVWTGFYLLTQSTPKENIGSIVGGLICVAFFAVLIGAQKIVYSLQLLASLPPVVGSENSDQNWQFATQFYFPPEELLSYLTTTQFFGAPEAYWGRDGNPTPLRLVDDYMGLIPLGFAIVAVFACWRIWQARVFILTGILSLFISFGREGLLYAILYQLPTMKSQRNPHRWSYFVSLAVAVLAAYGINWLISQFQETPVGKKNLKEATSEKWRSWHRVLVSLGALGMLLFFVSLILRPKPEALAALLHGQQGLSSPNGVLFLQQAKLMIASLFRTGYFLALSAAAVWLLIVLGQKEEWRNPRWKLYIPGCFVLLITILDLGFNAKRFVQFYDWKPVYEKNELIDYLKKDSEPYRVKILNGQQNQLLNQLTGIILPYHKIPVIDPPSASRIPTDYKYFFDYMSDHYVPGNHYFDIFNIKYVLSVGPLNDPTMALEPIAQWNGIQIFKRPNAMPRAWLVPQVKIVKEDKDAVLFATVHPGRNFYESVVLEENPKTSYPELKEYTKGLESNLPRPLDREAKVALLEDDQIRIETRANMPTFLVVSEKWDPNWKAWIDDVPAKIYRANFLMRGIELPAGNHIVRMEYRPSMTTFWISCISIIAFGLFGLVKLIKRLS